MARLGSIGTCASFLCRWAWVVALVACDGSGLRIPDPPDTRRDATTFDSETFDGAIGDVQGDADDVDDVDAVDADEVAIEDGEARDGDDAGGLDAEPDASDSPDIADVTDPPEVDDDVDVIAPEVDDDVETLGPDVDDETDAEPDAGDDATDLDGDTAVAPDADDAIAPACGVPTHGELWQDLASLQGDALRTALRDAIDEHSGLTYDQARDLMYITADIDVMGGLIECIYTGTEVAPDGTHSPGAITTEHSWPRSDGAAAFPAEGDIHHLFPATDASNNRRSNDEFGETACGHPGESTCDWGVGGSFSGPATDGRARVFEVRPAYRGDIARAHFYFAVRYALPISPLEEAVLRRWHCEDPVDERERARNDAIALWQLNRNPFVDQPQLVLQLLDF